MNNKLLIVIDVQNDFITGTLKNPLAEAKIPNIVKKIKEHDGNVIATHDTHFNELQVKTAWPPEDHAMVYEDTLEGKLLPVPHCIKLSEGWEIQKDVLEALREKNLPSNHHFFGIDKYTFGYINWKKYFDDGGFKFDEIELCGFVTSICVMANAVILRALYPNMKITVDANCVADITEEGQKAALAVLKAQQINVIGE